jgi:hypothetical protein
MHANNLADLYDLPALDWGMVTARLDAGISQAPDTGGPNRHTCWLTTLDADGAPHTTTLAVATHEFDLIVNGTAALVTDPATVARLAEQWASGGWPCRVDDSGTALTAAFSAPSAGKPPWHVFQITTVSATALATVEPGGATRWTW